MKRFDMEIQSQPYFMGDDDEGESDTVSPCESTNGDWVQWDDVAKLEESRERLLKASSDLLRFIDKRLKDDLGRPDLLDNLRDAIEQAK